jgi:hypothetical protein
MRQTDIIRWLEEQGIETTPVDPAVVAEYERVMREKTIPAILKAERENAKRVAEMRRKVLFR